jgi:hypothetical protein
MKKSNVSPRVRQPANKGRLFIVPVAIGVCGVIVALNHLSSLGAAPGGSGAEPPASQIPAQPPAGILDYRKEPQEAKRLVEKLARQTGGNFGKLTPDQQKLLDSMTAGHGAEMLRDTARDLAKKHSGKPAGRRPE